MTRYDYRLMRICGDTLVSMDNGVRKRATDPQRSGDATLSSRPDTTASMIPYSLAASAVR